MAGFLGRPGDEMQGLHDCLEDMRKIGAVTYSDAAWVKPTDLTLRPSQGITLRETWPSIFAPYLSPDQWPSWRGSWSWLPLPERASRSRARIQAVSVLEAMGWSVDHHIRSASPSAPIPGLLR